MSDIRIEATNNTPEVFFSIKADCQSIKGLSTPIDSFDFYRPLIQWVEENKGIISENTKFRFELNYFNSSSMKALLWLIQAIANAIVEGRNWEIEWVVTEEDEFMEEAAESFQILVDVPLKIVHI